MKCHYCKSDLIFYKYSPSWLHCPNNNKLPDTHYTFISKSNLPLDYSTVISYNDRKYKMYVLNNDKVTVIECFDNKLIMLKVNKLFDIEIIDDVPQFLPLLQKLLSLKAFS